ncbi:MAG: AraC family transcriptional regulator [Paracoccaceae bacterium]
MNSIVQRIVRHLPVPKVRASVARGIAELGVGRGVPLEEALAGAGLAPEDIRDLDQEVPALVVGKLMQDMARRFPDEPLGLQIAREIPASFFGPLGYAVRHAATVRDAMELFARYIEIVSSHARVRLEEDRGGLRVVLSHHPMIARLRHPIEAGLAMGCRSLGMVPPIAEIAEITFAHAPTGPVAAYRDFFGVTPHFGQRRNSVLFPDSYLDRALPQADAAYHDYLTKLLHRTPGFSALDDAEIGEALIWCADRGDYRVEALAERAGLTPRTLHRRLAQNGMSPRDLLDDARFGRAQGLLSDRALPITDIAFLLGYSEERAFIRAFKRWSGKTPAAYRAEQAGRQPA